MKHWTQENTRDAFGRPKRLYGVRIAVCGNVIGVIVATTNDDMHVFGAPVFNRQLTPAQSLAHAVPFALPAIHAVEGVDIPQRFDFPLPLDCIAVTLRYERTNGNPFALLDFHSVLFDPAMVSDFTLHS